MAQNRLGTTDQLYGHIGINEVWPQNHQVTLAVLCFSQDLCDHHYVVQTSRCSKDPRILRQHINEIVLFLFVFFCFLFFCRNLVSYRDKKYFDLCKGQWSNSNLLCIFKIPILPLESTALQQTSQNLQQQLLVNIIWHSTELRIREWSYLFGDFKFCPARVEFIFWSVWVVVVVCCLNHQCFL